MRKIQIGVIGDSSCSEEEVNLANEVGKEIALHDATLICGGRGGIMEGVSQGCKENKGLVIGILPGENETDSKANAFLDVVIPTNLGWTRNSIVALASDGLIIIGGKSGTLSEISFGWMYDKPLVALTDPLIPDNTWGRKLAGKQLDDRRKDKIWEANTPKHAVELLMTKILNKRTNHPK